MPTIRDVAQAAGVAPSTVSVVLNNKRTVSARTREAVLTAVEALHYVPTTAGRPRTDANGRQRARRHGQIAVLVNLENIHTSPIYMAVLHGVEAALAELHFSMLLRSLPQLERDPAPVLPKQIDGAVFLFPPHHPSLRRQLEALPSTQMMGLPDPAVAWDHVTYNNDSIGRLAAAHLFDLGCRHCAAVHVAHRSPSALMHQRSLAFQRAMESLGGTAVPIFPEEDCNPSEHPEGLHRALASLHRMTPPPTGLFVPMDDIVMGIYPYLHTHGLAPGRRLQVVSCNNDRPFLAGLKPRPATVDIHAAEVGRRAAEQLVWRLDHPDASRTTLILEPDLVRGDPPAPAPA